MLIDDLKRYFDVHGRSIALNGLGRDLRMDANESLAFARGLEYVYSTSYNAVYPDLKARTLIPVNTEGGDAEAFIYRGYQMIGQSKWIDDKSTDFPMVDMIGSETAGKYASFGQGYEFSDQQVGRAAFMGVQLPTQKAMACRMAADRFLDNVAAVGGPGLRGFATNPDVTVLNKTAGAGPALTGDWDAPGTTSDQIIADVDKAATFLFGRSQGVITQRSLSLAIPFKAYTALMSKRVSIYENMNLLTFLVSSGRVGSIEPWLPLTAVTGATGNGERGILYQKDPDVLELLIPQDYRQSEPQRVGFMTKVYSLVKTGGVDIHRPDRLAYLDEIAT